MDAIFELMAGVVLEVALQVIATLACVVRDVVLGTVELVVAAIRHLS